MKKLFTLFAAVLMAAMVLAQDKAKFTYEAGAEVVSSYIWRGLYNGGLHGLQLCHLQVRRYCR